MLSIPLILLLAGAVAVMQVKTQASPAFTNVSGPITVDTVWTEAGSPYLLSGDVIVERGVTLTIEPGAEVQGNGTELGIRGRLVASAPQPSPSPSPPG